MNSSTFVELSKNKEINLDTVTYVIYTNSGAVVHFISGKTLEIQGDQIEILREATRLHRIQVAARAAA